MLAFKCLLEQDGVVLKDKKYFKSLITVVGLPRMQTKVLQRHAWFKKRDMDFVSYDGKLMNYFQLEQRFKTLAKANW